MVLRVPFARFVEEARRHCPGALAYLDSVQGRVFVSVAEPGRGVIVQAEADRTMDSVSARLREAGLEVAEGAWLPDDALDSREARPLWVAAVAYRSVEEKPGLWIDASYERPTTEEVLERMYAELSEQGLLRGVRLEKMLRLAEPNVLVIGPEEAHRFAEERERATLSPP